MTFKYQSPFKEGEVPQILQRLRDSELLRDAEQTAARDSIRALFGEEWLVDERAVDAVSDSRDDENDDLDSFLNKLSASPAPVRECDSSSELDIDLFAGAPSYILSSSEFHPENIKVLPSVLLLPQQESPIQTNHAGAGVNAKEGHSRLSGRPLSTPSRAGLVAGFHLRHTRRVVAISEAISELDTDLDRNQLENLLRADAFIHKLMQSYQGNGELPSWAKFVSAEMKQYFRLHLLCTKPNAKTITIRLDHDSAEAALAAPRGPANYLAEIIKRTLAKLGIDTDLAFNLEFNHTRSTENHPLHIHGALCIPDDKVKEVSEALRKALALGYRQRYTNLAVHIEKPRSAHWWAAYCIKEYGPTISRLKAERGRENRPDYATQKLTQKAKTFYEDISTWLSA